MKNKKSVSALVVIGLIFMFILSTDSVCADSYKVGTFENDYIIVKNSFFKGENVYIKGIADKSSYPLKLRIIDPGNNIVYYSDESISDVFGSYFLDEKAIAGIWCIELGIFKNDNWDWYDSDRITYFSVSDINYTLTVSIIGSGYVILGPPGGSYPYNTSVNITAIANVGWSFSNWSGDVGIVYSTNPEKMYIIMNSNKTVNANFSPNGPYTLTLTTSGNGSGVVQVSPVGPYYYGATVTVWANASVNSSFVGFSGNLSGIGSPQNVSMDGNKVVNAVFVLNTYLLSLTVSGNGSGVVQVSPVGPYYYGATVTVWANASMNSSFVGFSGNLSGTGSPQNVTMDGNKVVDACFAINYYNLTVYITGSGTVNKNPNKTSYSYGELVTLTAVPFAGWSFSSWSGNLSGNINPVTINVTENKNITAHFIKSYNGGGGNGGTPTPPNEHPVANLSAGKPYFGFIFELIEFNASLSHDPDGKIVKYEWIFGDGTTGIGEITTHLYSIPGEYEVELKVTDNRGGTDTDETIAVIVVPNHSPSEPVFISPTEGKVNINYSFSMFSIDDDLDEIKYTVDWGDGNITESDYIQSGALFNTSHLWLMPGEYNIKVKSYDGKINTIKDLTIIIQEPDKTPIVPESNNFILIAIGLLALILLISVILIAKRKKV